MSAWDTLASSPGGTSRYLPRGKMAPARGNSISAASEKTGCLLMGCSREEGLHLYSSHECKIEISVSPRAFGPQKSDAGCVCSCVVIVLLPRSDIARVVSGNGWLYGAGFVRR